MFLQPSQIKAARAMLGWTQVQLARAAGISEMSIKKIERGETDPRVSTLTAIQTALESSGVVFLNEGDTVPGGPGVRLRGRDGLAGTDQGVG